MSRFNGGQHNYEAVCTTESIWQLSPFHSYLPYLPIADICGLSKAITTTLK